ncbi:MAG TPA: CsbD family protein [Phenylobacterium sp.]|nr:CsbD family protein [Phenylobacterium sp.]
MPTLRFAVVAALALAATGLTACDRSHESGETQKAIGHVESAAGDVTGSEKLKSQGKHDEVVGGVKSAAGDVRDTVKDAMKK